MTVLAIQKLQDVEQFSTMFLNYDLLAKRWVPYGKVYPFGEALAGILMTAGILPWLSAPVALFIGTIGAVSVFKAVYVEKRDLKCACVERAARLRIADRKPDDDGNGPLDGGARLFGVMHWRLKDPPLATASSHWAFSKGQRPYPASSLNSFGLRTDCPCLKY